jgi:hypothetical protein
MNTDQMNLFFLEEQVDREEFVSSEKGYMASGKEAGAKSSLILRISQKIIRASSWTGDKESKLSVIKCLASVSSHLSEVKKDEGIDVSLTPEL